MDSSSQSGSLGFLHVCIYTCVRVLVGGANGEGSGEAECSSEEVGEGEECES